MKSRVEKQCIINILRDKHKDSRKKEKGRIISELCERLLVGRKQAIRLLSRSEVGRPRKLRLGRPSKYQDLEFKNSLRQVWKITDYLCGRRLKEAIPFWLPAIEEEHGAFSADIKERLLAISPPTIDRILKPFKANKGKSYTRSGGFREQIPIQENIWDIKVPGYMETDTVAHCGGSTFGEFINTVTMVDIATIWTEARAVYGRGSNAVLDGIKDIEHKLPFQILGYDADNGGEVLNRQLFSYFHTERIQKGLPPVAVTRSREYKKNDNAHVEQRNDSIARKYLGYDRFGFKELVPLINYYYAEIVCPLNNHFYPCFKLADKIKIKSRIRRIYNKPMTPYARLIDSEYLPHDKKIKLKQIHSSLNPVRLAKQEKIIRKLIDDSIRKLKLGLDMQLSAPHYKLWNPLL